MHQALAAQLQLARDDERDLELPRDPVVLPVGGVAGPSVSTTTRPSAEHAPQRRRDAVERQRSAGHVEPAQHRRARGGPVADPARRAHVVLEHEPLAFGVAHEVEAGDPDPDAVARAHARHRRLEVVRAVEHALRQDALGDDPALAVDVGDERVERAHALREARREALPLGGADHARDGIDVPAVVAVDGLEADAPRVDLVAHARRELGEVVGEHGVHDRARAGRMLPSGATASS